MYKVIEVVNGHEIKTIQDDMNLDQAVEFEYNFSSCDPGRTVVICNQFNEQINVFSELSKLGIDITEGQ